MNTSPEDSQLNWTAGEVSDSFKLLVIYCSHIPASLKTLYVILDTDYFL